MNVKTGLILLLLAFVFGSAALAEEPTDYRFPRECMMTPAGYPVPLCGASLRQAVDQDPRRDQAGGRCPQDISRALHT